MSSAKGSSQDTTSVGTSSANGSQSTWIVNKFGGTSVASAEAMSQVKEIVMNQVRSRGEDKKMAVVVSAMGGKPKVTDLLLKSISLAAVGDLEGVELVVSDIHTKHVKAIELLRLPVEECERIKTVLESDLSDVKDLLKAVSLMKHEDSQIRELVSGFGEAWSCQVLCALLNQNSEEKRFAFLDARRVLIVADAPEGEALSLSPAPEIDWERSFANIEEFLSSEEALACPTGLVITGFVASTSQGVATTLRRDGSDYSASIFGKLLAACAVNIWTDVDGVLSADPRKVAEAKVLSEVSFSEAMELAYFGAKVIHPKTMQPAVSAGIPLFIKNTFNPGFPGTRIFTSSTATKDRRRCVCGFSTMDNIALLNLEGMGMKGFPGIAARLFGALQRLGISVILISQASSEHSISVAIEASRATAAAKVTEEAFAAEIKHGTVGVDLMSPCCIVAAVGDGMSHTTGVAGRFFSALGSANVNILAIAQGCSERNISCVVEQHEGVKALRAVHAAFLLSHMTVSVGLVGAGAIGNSLLGMLVEQREMLRTQFGLDLQIRAVANGDKMLLSDDSIDSAYWNESLHSPPGVEETREGILEAFNGGGVIWSGNSSESSLRRKYAQPLDVAALVDFVRTDHLPHSVIVDCSTASTATREHASWLSRGVHVVSSNKMAGGGCLSLYHELLQERDRSSASYHYETTVGGALPVISTLQNLRSAGDEVLHIEGVVSAFLSYVFNRLSPGPGVQEQPVAFSKACWDAAEKGLMDLGDVVKDLGCEDQRRSALILGRELGLELQESDVVLEPVLEESCSRSGDTVARVSALDHVMRRRADDARGRGKVLRYVVSIDAAEGTAQAGIRELDMSHPYASLEGATFCVMYKTRRYFLSPRCLQSNLQFKASPVQMKGTTKKRLQDGAECVTLYPLLAIALGCVATERSPFAWDKRMEASTPLILQGPVGGPETVASGLLADLLRVCTSLGARDRGHRHLMKSRNSFSLDD